MIVCEHYPRLCSRTVQGLVHALSKMGHEIIVVTTNIDTLGKSILEENARSEIAVRFVSIKIPGVPYLYTPRARAMIQYLVQKYRPDIVHCHFLMFWLSLMTYSIPNQGVPVIVTLHGLTLPSEFEFPVTRLLLRLIYLTFAPRLLRNTARVICVSNDTKRRLQAVFPYITPKSSVIPNGIDPLIENGRTKLLRQECRDLLQLSNRLTFLYVGRITADKGVISLVRAFKRLNTKYGNTSLLIVGDGPELGYLITKYHNDCDIHFLGYRDDVGTYCQASDVAVMASSREGMSMFVLEAMFHGLPIISSEVGGIQELQQKGANIEILRTTEDDDIYQSLEKFVHMAGKERILMGEKNKQVIQNNFIWEKLGSNTVEIYRSVLKKTTV
jgi:glycosyltransferase involved in cell wall biosynthesis